MSKTHETNPRDVREVLINRLLMWLVSIVESQSMRTLENRMSLLVCGGWLPGKADTRSLAALTNRPESSIASVVGDTPRPKFKVGRQTFYRLSDFAQADNKPTKKRGAK